MTAEELETILDHLQSRRMFNEVFVIVVERDGSRLRLLDYGLREIGDLAAWLAVYGQYQQQPTKGDQKA